MAAKTTAIDSRNWLLTRRWMLVASAMLFLWIVAQIDKTNVSLIIADRTFLKELNLAGRNAELGGLMSTFFMGYGLSLFAWGFLVDRFGARNCAIAGSIAWGALVFVSSRITTINEFLIVRFLLGAAEGNLWPVCNALTNRWFPAREHGRVQSFWVSGSTLGTAVGVPLMSGLMLASNWRGALTFLSAVSLLPVLVFVFIGNRPANSPKISEHAGTREFGDRKGLRDLSKSTPFWLVTACQFVSCTTIYTMIQWIPSYLTASRHLSFKAMGAWITLGYVLATLLTLLVGYIADRTMQRSLTGAAVCLAFAILVMPALALSPEGSAVALSALIAVPGAIAALNGALAHALVQQNVIARATGFYTGIGNVVSAVGPVTFGALISALGGRYWGGFLFVAILNAAGAGIYFALYRQSKTKRAPLVEPLLREVKFVLR
jgi:ACS family glucarate transporter-like MFS transporter